MNTVATKWILGSGRWRSLFPTISDLRTTLSPPYGRAMTIYRRAETKTAVMCLAVITVGFAVSCGIGPAAAQDAEVPFNTITAGEPGEAQSLTGTGGSFPVPLYKAWFDAYSSKIGVKVEYKAEGSAEGIKAISARHMDFAGTDAPMTDVQLAVAAKRDGPVLHIPAAFGAIALIYNIPGLEAPLKLTAQDITGIYLGEITHWNDPRLVRDNPQLARITQEIIVVHRADGSGSTYAFTDYLYAHSQLWQIHSRKGTSAMWPVGIGGRGGSGLADLINANPFSIGYGEVGLAVKNNLKTGLVKNSAGQFIAPSQSGIAAAAEAAGQRAPADLRFSTVDAPGAGAYPICTATWLLAHRNMTDRSKAMALTRLLWWAIHDAQAVNPALGYAKLPPVLVERSAQLIREINVGGQPAFSGR
jgi:phosphate transport system substrate-binding protein